MATDRIKIPILGMTCASCVSRIEQALRSEPAIVWADVNFAAEEVTVIYEPSGIQPFRLVQIVRELGFDVPAKEFEYLVLNSGGSTLTAQVMLLLAPVGAGLAGAAFLVALYLGLVTWAQDRSHAVDLLWGDRWLVGAIAAGFAIQVGLYVYLRQLTQRSRALGASTALAATGTGTSSAAMIACCAHHLADVLPIIGLTAAATFLNQYRIPFMLAGLTTNVVGIAVTLRLISHVRYGRSCSWPSPELRLKVRDVRRRPRYWSRA